MKKQSMLVLCFLGVFCINVAVRGAHCGPDKIPYDPATQGCCRKPDGTYEVTDKSENTDPCTLNEVQEDLCKRYYGYGDPACDKYGVTVCYNGEKVGCVCNCMGVQNTSLLACIQAHEDAHAQDDNLKCEGCDTKKPKPQNQSQAEQDECDLTREARDCAMAIPGWRDNPEIEDFVNNMNYNLGLCQP